MPATSAAPFRSDSGSTLSVGLALSAIFAIREVRGAQAAVKWS
jgi:hypothetical protein